MNKALFFFGLLILSVNLPAQISYQWNGSVSPAWNLAANWTPAGIPGSADHITITAGGNICTLSGNQTVANFTLTGGILNLSGYKLIAGGNDITLTAGNIQNGTFEAPTATTTTIGSLAGTVDFICAVSISSENITIRNSTFRSIAHLTKTGAGIDRSYGGNAFKGSTIITNAGSDDMILAYQNGDIYQSDATFNNSGSAALYVAHSGSGNEFQGITTFNNTASGSGFLFVSRNANSVFTNHIIVSSTSGRGIFIGDGSSPSSATLAAGKTISAGGAGFTAGTLSLNQFIQKGNTPQNLLATGNATIDISACRFEGQLTVTSPGILLGRSVFNSSVELTKTDGNTTNPMRGGNTFNATVKASYLSTSGTGYWSFSNSEPDIFNGDVYLYNNSLDRIIMNHGAAANQLNGNLYLSQTGASAGISLGWNAESSATLAAGKSILIGPGGFDAGYLYIQCLRQLGQEPINLVTTGTSSVHIGNGDTYTPTVINGPLRIVSPDIFLRGARFENTVSVTKTGGTDNHNRGNQNIFNATLNIFQQSNSGYFMLSYASNDRFNGDIVVNSSGTKGILIGYVTGNGNPELAPGKTIVVGPSGFTAGYLSINNFQQKGNRTIDLVTTGTSYVEIKNNTVINGDLKITAPGVRLGACTFNGKVNVTKTGSMADPNSGNIFNGVSRFVNSGSGYLMFGSGSPDVWNADVYFVNNGSERILLAWNSENNRFNGNVYFSSTGSSSGVHFCGYPQANAILSSGKSMFIGAEGFSAGTLRFERFIQEGNQPINLTLTGAASTLLQITSQSDFTGPVKITAPRILINNSLFGSDLELTKTGTQNEWSAGGNIFNGTTTYNHKGAGFFGFANGSPDIYNSDLYINNNSSERILLATGSVGNRFNGNIIVTQAGSAAGISIGYGVNSASSMAAGKTISIGSAGFTAGFLQIGRITQLGSQPILLNMSGTGSLSFGPEADIGGDIISNSAGISFNGGVYRGTVNAKKFGASNDNSAGNNVFKKSTAITNNGSGYILLGSGNPDEFAADATFINAGTNHFYIAQSNSSTIFGGPVTFSNFATGNAGIFVSNNSTGTLFSDHVVVNSTGGLGVQFCASSANSSVILTAGKTISVGPQGFSAGTLLLKQFIQKSATPQNLLLSGTALLSFNQGSSFDGDITSTSGGLLFNGSVFNGTVKSKKTGTTNDQGSGGNTFQKPVTLENAGTGYLLTGNVLPDTFLDDVSLIKSSTGVIHPSYQTASTYAGNIFVKSATPITFAGAAGTIVMNGSRLQNIDAHAGSAVPVFKRLVIANTGAGVKLQSTPIQISGSLALNTGLLHTTSSNILTMLNGSTVGLGTALATSYVNGPMRYQKSTSGMSTLNFPIGQGDDCRPAMLTITHTNAALYTYEATLFNESASALGYSLPITVDRVSDKHYYTIERTDASGKPQPSAGLSGTQTIELYFDVNDRVSEAGTVTIVKTLDNNPTTWFDIGGAAVTSNTGKYLAGKVVSTSAPTLFNSFSTFALANKKGGLNVLPVSLISFGAQLDGDDNTRLTWATSSENGNSFFTIEKSMDGIHFSTCAMVESKAVNGNSSLRIDYNLVDRNPGSGKIFYRLKQTNINGRETLFNIVSVQPKMSASFMAFPNPAKDYLTIHSSGWRDGKIHVQWYDLAGKTVKSEMPVVHSGRARVATPAKSGMYLLNLTTSDGAIYQQIIVVR